MRIKGDIIIMNNNATDIQGQVLAGVNETANTELDEQGSTDIQQPQSFTVNAPKRNAGRPKRSDGIENRNNRFNLQLQPSMRKKLNILAEYDNCSATDIISRILEQYINTRIDDINYMTRIKRDIEMRKANQAGNETY